jgi:hypothetical protein
MKLFPCRSSWILNLLLFSSLLLGGCTKEAAKALKDTAKLFGDESIAAINAVETMILAETQEPSLTEVEKKVRFLQIILAPVDDQSLVQNLEQLMTPVEPSKSAVITFKAYMASLRSQYTTLVSIYDDLERGHLLAKDAVKKSQLPLQKLTFQMSYLAICADTYPTNLLKQKSSLIAEIIKLRRLYFTTRDPVLKKEIEGKILEKFVNWEQIQAKEQALTQNVIEHSAKAALMGRELNKQIEHYDDINLERLNSMLINVINIVSLGTGREYTTLQKEVHKVWETINNDKDYKAAANAILAEFPKTPVDSQSNLSLTIQGCSVLFSDPNPTPSLKPSSNTVPPLNLVPLPNPIRY